MPTTTEESISDLVAEYLRNESFNAQREVSYTGNNRGKPDLELVHDKSVFLGEAKWEDNKWEGFGQARDYGEYSDVSGSFLIIYPNELKQEIRQSRIGQDGSNIKLEGHDFRAAFLKNDEDTDMFRGDIAEFTTWLKNNLEDRGRRTTDSDEIIDIFDQMVQELRRDIEDIDESADLFNTLLGGDDISSDLKEVAEKGSAYLLLNQITFYHILSEQRDKYEKINTENLDEPSDLQLYFNDVLEDDYNSVFGVSVANYFDENGLDVIKQVVNSVQGLRPETLDLDILGKVFHRLIPYDIRKKVAAYYTKHEAAEILSDLSIEEDDDAILDPACGSGTLLVSGYNRKKKLTQKTKSFSSEDHMRFLENEIYGLDIMPFAGHLSTIHLALQAPVYMTDYVNIGIADSTKYHPGDEIMPLTRVMPESETQRSVSDFSETKDISEDTIEAGSLNLDAMPGNRIELKSVDSVIMNPPFTRQESIAKFSSGYKDKLETRFQRYSNKISRRMSFCSYFLLLADKFLNEGGRIAAVLPASTLRKDSNKGVRELLLDKYDIKSIIARSDAPNFSEDTSLREILLIAEKTDEKSDYISYFMLEGLDSDMSNTVRNLDSVTRSGGIMKRENVEIRNIPRDSVQDNLFEHISCIDFALYSIWKEISDSDRLESFSDMDITISEGARSRGGGKYPEMSIYESENECQGNRDIWYVEEISESFIEVENRFTGDRLDIPKSAVEPNFRKMSGRMEINVSELDEFVITDDFPDFSRYTKLSDLEMRKFPSSWQDYLMKRVSRFAIPCKFRINSDNTHLLSYYSDHKRAWTNALWSVSGLTSQSAKIQSLWFNSTLNLLQIIIKRAPVEGGWLRLDKYILEDFKGLKTENLEESQIDAIYSLFEEFPTENPSLKEQIASNVVWDNVDDSKQEEIAGKLDLEIDEEVECFNARRELDLFFLEVLNVENNRDELLNKIYVKVLFELAKFDDISS